MEKNISFLQVGSSRAFPEVGEEMSCCFGKSRFVLRVLKLRFFWVLQGLASALFWCCGSGRAQREFVAGFGFDTTSVQASLQTASNVFFCYWVLFWLSVRYWIWSPLIVKEIRISDRLFRQCSFGGVVSGRIGSFMLA